MGYDACEEFAGPFGYMKDGNGTVIFIFDSKYDDSVGIEAVKYFIEEVYTETVIDEDGDEIPNVSEYFPSTLMSETYGELQDFVSLNELVKKNDSNEPENKKIYDFLVNEVIAKDIPVILCLPGDILEQQDADYLEGRLLEEPFEEDYHIGNVTMYIRNFDPYGDY